MTLSSSRRVWMIALALVAAASLLLGYLALRDSGEPTASPSPSPVPSVTPSPTPIPLAQPQPFAMRMGKVGVREMGNDWLFRGRIGNTRRGAAKPARRAVAQLRRYLNTALVAPESRFTAAPVRRLLTKPAERLLGRRDRRALGVGATDYAGGRSRPVRVKPVVLYDGKRAYAVTVKYQARLDVIMEGERRRRPLRQSGVMVFVPTAVGWRADMVEVSLRLPPAPRRPATAPPSPSPSPAPTTQETPS